MDIYLKEFIFKKNSCISKIRYYYISLLGYIIYDELVYDWLILKTLIKKQISLRGYMGISLYGYDLWISINRYMDIS